MPRRNLEVAAIRVRENVSCVKDGWTLHELRHSFLSLASASGVHPAVMQQLAGHSSAQTTMDIYTHVNMDSKRAAVMAMQDAFME